VKFAVFWPIWPGSLRLFDIVLLRRIASVSVLALGFFPFASPVSAKEPVAETVAVDPKAPEDTRRRYVVAAIGDSLTDTRVGGGRYMKMLQERCPESRFDAYGVGGQQTRHMRNRIAGDVFGEKLPRWMPERPKYTHLVVLGGVNDLSVGVLTESRLGPTRDNLTAMYTIAREHGVKVVAVTVPPWGHVHGPRDLAISDGLNAWILERARAGAVDAVADVAPLLECGTDRQLCLTYRKIPSDFVHWSEQGHRVVANALFEAAFSDCR
jgi:lysophospholipase L1-like esterase